MRRGQSTITPSAVHAYARQLLVAGLELRDYKRSVPAGLLASVLLLAACWQASLSAACSLLRGAPSAESVRKAAHAALPRRPRELLERLLACLRDTLPDHLGRRPLPFAIDLHQRPYYGRFTKGCTRRKKKAGSRRSFTYATLAALAPEGRFTAGLLPTRPHMRHETVLGRLLAQAAQAGLQVAYLLLDREFYSVEVMAWLQRHRVPFLMPTRTTGKRPPFDEGRAPGWYEHTWEAYPRRRDFATGEAYRSARVRVAARVCVARSPRGGGRLTYAAWGLGKWPPAVVVQVYRGRFGIEAGYRQLGQCLAATSSRDERYRLLLVGVALLLTNVWALLHSEALAAGALGERRRRLAALRLLALRQGLAAVVVALLGGLATGGRAQRPLPARPARAGDAA